MFENCFISEDNLLSDEGHGFKIAMNALDRGRITIGSIGVGCARRGLDEAVKYSLERRQFNQEIYNCEKYKCNSIVICVDANVRSHRYLDRESFYDARKYGKRTNPLSPNPTIAKFYNWKLIKYIISKTKLPVFIKGILTYEDSLNALKNGASGIWVSNHGGRMFNSGISSIEALKKISLIKKKI